MVRLLVDDESCLASDLFRETGVIAIPNDDEVGLGYIDIYMENCDDKGQVLNWMVENGWKIEQLDFSEDLSILEA